MGTKVFAGEMCSAAMLVDCCLPRMETSVISSICRKSTAEAEKFKMFLRA
jgi:hypothetical protein